MAATRTAAPAPSPPECSGLSLLIDCLTSILVSNPVVFAREVERLVRNLKVLPRSEGTEEILMPGERGERMYAKRSREGIPVPAPILKELEALAGRLSIDPTNWKTRLLS